MSFIYIIFATRLIFYMLQHLMQSRAMSFLIKPARYLIDSFNPDNNIGLFSLESN